MKSKLFHFFAGGLCVIAPFAVWWFYFGMEPLAPRVIFDSAVQIESISDDTVPDAHKPTPKTPKSPKDSESGVGMGSGVAFRHVPHKIDGQEVNDTLLITAAHVIEGAKQIIVHYQGENIEVVPADIIAKDTRLDLAVIKVPRELPIANMFFGNVYRGDSEWVVGNSYGQGLSMTYGFIGEMQPNGLRQASASIWPGNSGGGVFIHRDGRYVLVGVVVRGLRVGMTIANTVTYFVPMPMVQEFLSRSGIN